MLPVGEESSVEDSTPSPRAETSIVGDNRFMAATITSHRLVVKGPDSFRLQLEDREIWFVVKPGTKSTRPLPYLGKLRHSDFALRFVEIKSEHPEALDALFDQEKAFVIGCDAFTHYRGVKSRDKQNELTAT